MNELNDSQKYKEVGFNVNVNILSCENSNKNSIVQNSSYLVETVLSA